MNILLFIDNLGSGGAQRQLVNLGISLKDEGYKVKFLCYDKAGFYKQMLHDGNVSVDYVVSNTLLGRIIKIRRYIRSGDQDIVISFLDTPNFLACVSSIGRRKWKLITSERSAKEVSFISTKGKIYKWFARYSDMIVCNSFHSQKMWEEHYPKYKEKLCTIYNLIRCPNCKSVYIPRKDGKLRLVIAASYQYLKNVDGLIEAVKMLSEEEKNNIQVDWYGRIEVTSGNTQAYDDAVEKVKSYGIKNINLNAEVKNIIPIMANADFVCLFSKVEGLPNAVCEGMVLGKPIIMTKVSDYYDLVRDNGLLCDPDPESIKITLQKALQLSISEIQNMGTKSSERAKTLFGKESIMSEWIRLIHS